MKWLFLAVVGAAAGSMMAWVLMYGVAVVLELAGMPLQDSSLHEPRMFQIFVGIWVMVALAGAAMAIRAGRPRTSHRW